MNELQIIEIRGQRVLTTKQIAEMYETDKRRVNHNFQYNKARYVEGKHYIMLSGEELKRFKNECLISTLVGTRTSALYLWTEKGALLHAKAINTDKAWEVYEYLVDFYFRVKEEQTAAGIEKTEVAPVQPVKTQEKQLPYMKHPIGMLSVLYKAATDMGMEVRTCPFKASRSMLYGNRIGIRENTSVEQACYEMAWELSHAILHYDAGNMIESPYQKQYYGEADRAAELIIRILNAGMA